MKTQPINLIDLGWKAPPSAVQAEPASVARDDAMPEIHSGPPPPKYDVKPGSCADIYGKMLIGQWITVSESRAQTFARWARDNGHKIERRKTGPNEYTIIKRG